MKILLKNGFVINVFTKELEKKDVLIEDHKIIGVDNYKDENADVVKDITNKYVCPGFIDGHIHIESSLLTPYEFTKLSLPHGTTTLVADPHEIANVCGIEGIKYFLEASKDLPITMYFMLPSCVPATPFCESGAILEAKDLKPLYQETRVLGLGEVMNYVGVINRDSKLMEKIQDAKAANKIINGHAPLLSGKDLDKYVSCDIKDDHECTSEKEAKERIRKGQIVMVREGTASKNLRDLLGLFDEPFCNRCILVTDDINADSLMRNGHIDNAVRIAVKKGKNIFNALSMATIQAAKYYGLNNIGAVAPGYIADILILDDFYNVDVCDVYKNGELVVENKKIINLEKPQIDFSLNEKVTHSFNMKDLTEKDFYIDEQGKRKCRVIEIIPFTLLTNEFIKEIDFDQNNGISIEEDILKIAVIERHNNTNHIGLGFVKGMGLKKGAIASSVSHDSHNLIIVGTNIKDMVIAGNEIKKQGGGEIIVDNGKILSTMPLPIAGLMSDQDANEISLQSNQLKECVRSISDAKGIEPFMNMAFLSLPVIPHLKLITHGLIDVQNQKLVSLIYEE